MKPSSLKRLVFPRLFPLCPLVAALVAGADTLYFQPTLDAMRNINESWFSLNNWYFSLTPVVVGSTHLPGAGDTVYVVLSEYRCVVGPNAVSFDTLNAEANIVGGDFSVITINSSAATFNGSTLTVQSQWNSQNHQLVDATVNIKAGALLFVDGATLYADNSTLYDIGQIELKDGGQILFASGTNQLAITTNAQFTGIGNTAVINSPGNPLILAHRVLVWVN